MGRISNFEKFKMTDNMLRSKMSSNVASKIASRENDCKIGKLLHGGKGGKKNGGCEMSKMDEKDRSEMLEEFCSIMLAGIREIQFDMEDEEEGPYDQLVAQYLDTDRSGLAAVSKMFAPCKRNLMLIAVYTVINEKCNGGGMAFAINDFEEIQIPPRYMSVDIDINTEAKCLWYGYQQLEMNGKKLVVDVDCSNKVPMFNVLTSKEESAIGEEFIKYVDEYLENRNPFRGQSIQMGVEGFFEFVDAPNKTWDDVIIPDDIRDELIYNTVWPIEKADVFKSNGLPTKRGVMLEGQPGIGKTMAINAIATYMKGKATTIWVPARSISQADDVAQIYNTARELAPSILFFEDIDLIATDRAIAGNYSPILGELLGQLDGLESNDTVITIASTNYPECIEKALRDRPSRFDRRIQFELPTEEAREKMLGIFTTKIKLADDVNLRKIAEESKGFTGAYIRELVSTAAIEAIKNSDNSSELVISEKDFSEALSKFKNKGKKFGIAGT